MPVTNHLHRVGSPPARRAGGTLTLIWLKTCPRCRGDLILSSEPDYEYVSCIQCGNILSEEQERSLRAPAPNMISLTNQWRNRNGGGP